jgi:hypothetical protein
MKMERASPSLLRLTFAPETGSFLKLVMVVCFHKAGAVRLFDWWWSEWK